MANYVKFVRGLSDLFSKLAVKDANTLYFIYENESSESGRLYLGDREIVCDGSGTSAAAYLKDLLDVSLPENVSELIDGQVLTYDATTSQWVARDPSAVADVLFDSNQFETNDNGEWSLMGFANAPSGARLTKSSDGKLIWELPSGASEEELAEQVALLRTDVDNLTGKFNDYDTSAVVDSKIAEAVGALNHLSYKTVDTIGDIDFAEDQYIYLVKNGEVYDEYMVVNGKLEKVGDWNVDLSEYAKKTEVQAVSTQVEDLASLLNSTNQEVATVKNNVANIATKVENLENSMSAVMDVASQLNQVSAKVAENTSAIEEQAALIQELQDALDDKVSNEEFEEFKAAMSWKTLSENA